MCVSAAKNLQSRDCLWGDFLLLCGWGGLLLPAPLHPFAFTKKRKKNSLMVMGKLQKQICIFSIYLTSHTCLCSPQALASLLAAPPTHYLNSEFLSGFSQFSHTFNLWRNEWWLLSIKKIKKPDRLTAHTGGLVSRGDEVFLCAAVCLFDGV